MAAVVISLGHNAEFYIDDETGFGIRQVINGRTIADVPLGEPTERRLDTILLHMGHLRIHTKRS